jgi:CRP-like cAMP-binding protein
MHRGPVRASRASASAHGTYRAAAKGAFAFGAFPIPLVAGRKYPAGVEVLRQGDIAMDVWIIDDGVVKLVYVDEEGRELTVGLRLKGWMLGSASVILEKPSPVAAFTMTPCYLQRLDAPTFLEMLGGNSTLSSWLHKMHSQEVFDHLVAFTQANALSARRRLEHILAQFVQPLEGNAQGTDVRIRLPLSQRDLAGLVGITPEHLSRLFRQLVDDGLIRRNKGSIIVTDLRHLMSASSTASYLPTRI